MMNLDLSGRLAVVTGASKGIGAAAVRLLADHGARVAFCARGRAAVAALGGHRPASGPGSVRGYVADLADAGSTAAFLEAVDRDLGPADILVNNVGASPSRNFLYMTDEDWRGLHELNLLSAVRCTRHCIPHMRERGWGRVVMVASTAAFYPRDALIDYSATKAAMIAMAKGLAGKYARDGVLVNSVVPGRTRTDMWERAASELARSRDTTVEAVFEAQSKDIPVGRYARPEEIANGIVFLASEAASFISGSCLTIDGGMGAHL